MRNVQISIPNLGQAEVLLGRTRVFANVSCEIVRPSASKPTEGSIFFNADNEQLARVLDKALRKSRAVDTEGLCIVAGEKVWNLRVNVSVIDAQGNILDCACIAAITALIHFRRPDVSVIGHDVVIVI
jgi:exosome complex component RRP45